MSRDPSSRRGRHAAPGCCSDCAVADPVPVLPPHPVRRWQGVVIAFVLWWFSVIAAGIIGAVTQKCEAQQIRVDTSTAQYKANRALVDSIASVTLVKWLKAVPLPGWRLILRADTLAEAVAQTRLNEPYRNALIVLDLRGLEATDYDEAILHELNHIRFSQYSAFVQLLLGGHESSPLLWELQRKEESYVTDVTRAMLWR